MKLQCARTSSVITFEVWLELKSFVPMCKIKWFDFLLNNGFTFTLWFMNIFRHIPTIQMFDHTIAYYDNWLNFIVSIVIFLASFSFCTIACNWNFIFLINLYMFFFNSCLNVILLYFFSIFSVVGERFVSDDDVDDDDDDNDADGG